MLTKAIFKRYLTRNARNGLYGQRFFCSAQKACEIRSSDCSGFVTVRDSNNYLMSHDALWGKTYDTCAEKYHCSTGSGFDASTPNSIHRWVIQLDR